MRSVIERVGFVEGVQPCLTATLMVDPWLRRRLRTTPRGEFVIEAFEGRTGSEFAAVLRGCGVERAESIQSVGRVDVFPGIRTIQAGCGEVPSLVAEKDRVRHLVVQNVEIDHRCIDGSASV